MNFSKWTGLGNDFVFLEPGESLDFGSGFEQRIIKLCDRRFGIGADGVVLVTPMDGEGCLVLNGVGGAGPASKAVANGVDFEMRIFNADGSEAAMCGNATRCVAKFIRSLGLAKSEDTKVFNLHTKSGLVRPALLDDGRVCVDMGLPRTFLGSIKLTADCYDFTAETVSMGNPHAVFFVEKPTDELVLELGPQIETDPRFPRRTNVEFVRVISRAELEMRVWERGTGETLACGTGACAAAVAAILNGKTDRAVTIHLLGGDLFIEWNESDGHVMMTGPAREVFSGEWLG